MSKFRTEFIEELRLQHLQEREEYLEELEEAILDVDLEGTGVIVPNQARDAILKVDRMKPIQDLDELISRGFGVPVDMLEPGSEKSKGGNRQIRVYKATIEVSLQDFILNMRRSTVRRHSPPTPTVANSSPVPLHQLASATAASFYGKQPDQNQPQIQSQSNSVSFYGAPNRMDSASLPQLNAPLSMLTLLSKTASQSNAADSSSSPSLDAEENVPQRTGKREDHDSDVEDEEAAPFE